jgi:hypothetical protein
LIATPLPVITDEDQQLTPDKQRELHALIDQYLAPLPDGVAGAPGTIMRINAKVVQQIGKETLVSFISHPVTGSGPGVPYNVLIAVHGMPDTLATGDSWSGVVYPAGTIQFGGAGTTYHRYTVTREDAVKILSSNPIVK